MSSELFNQQSVKHLIPCMITEVTFFRDKKEPLFYPDLQTNQKCEASVIVSHPDQMRLKEGRDYFFVVDQNTLVPH